MKWCYQIFQQNDALGDRPAEERVCAFLTEKGLTLDQVKISAAATSTDMRMVGGGTAHTLYITVWWIEK